MKKQMNHQDRYRTMRTSRIDRLVSYGNGQLLPRFSLDRSVRDHCKTSSMAKYDILHQSYN